METIKTTAQLTVFDAFARRTVLPIGSTITVELVSGPEWIVIYKNVRFTSPREMIMVATA